ncbi:MAG TPA: peptide-methionine (S)-S-oxide reductase MsrA [Candidatus Acidoferrales bacterium]|nr:peptide-methionine (S)-S-oxide reductase MsrA [Candidatus Acidoferrales bacterium]
MHLIFALLTAVQLATTAGAAPSASSEQIVLSGGCFWGMEAVFDQLKGVTNVVSGYAGGKEATAHYDLVSTGLTGHAESVQITFDPSKVSLQQLFAVYFLVAHDPTQLDRQGPDVGSQYRSVIWYEDDAQQQAARDYIKLLTARKVYGAPIVTQVQPLVAFYPAEAYHQHFVARNPDNPYVVYEDLPKLARLRQQFPDLVK